MLRSPHSVLLIALLLVLPTTCRAQFALPRITGNGLANVHGLAFSPTGELFCADHAASGLISRFTFSPDGDPQPNGTIATGNPNHGLASAPGGDLFLTQDSARLGRIRFDGTGQVLDQTFYPQAGSVFTGIAFSPQGEIFVADLVANQIRRFLLDATGSPVPNGSFLVPSSPLGVAFHPGTGELFVSHHSFGSGGISRYLFDASGQPVANGFFSTQTLGGPALSISVGPGDTLYVPVAVRDSGPPSVWGGVLRFQLSGSNTLTALSPIDRSLFSDPIYLVFDSQNVLFAANRHGNLGEGSISRIVFEPPPPPPIGPGEEVAIAEAPGPIHFPDPLILPAQPNSSSESSLPEVGYTATGQEQGLLPRDPNAIPPARDGTQPACIACVQAEDRQFDNTPSSTNTTLVGDPVHFFTGRLFMQHRDTGWTSFGSDVAFDRSYSTDVTRRGQLGIGWSHAYERRLVDRGSQGMTEIDGRGVAVTFPRTGTSGFIEQGGITLTASTDGTYQTRYPTGRTFHYRSLSPPASSAVGATGLTYIQRGSLSGNGLENVHGIAFSPTGEIFCANHAESRLISRFRFDADGEPVPNGTFVAGLENEGLAFAPGGDLFTTADSNVLRRIRFDAAGNVIGQTTHAIPGAVNLHGLAFRRTGELFITDFGTTQVHRCFLDANGDPVPSGVIDVGGTSIGVAFHPVTEELFITLHGVGGILRYGFDGAGNAIFNGSLATPSLGSPAISLAFAPDSTLVVPQSLAGSIPPSGWGGVLLYRFMGTGPLDPMPMIDRDLVRDPIYAAFSPSGELFISNRHGNVGDGSVSRFLLRPRLRQSVIHHLDAVVDPAGNRVQLSYSPEGDLVRIEDDCQRAMTLEVVDGLVRSITSPDSTVVRFAYNNEDRLAVFTNPRGGLTSFTYEPESHNILSMTLPSGDRVEYTYDAPREKVVRMRDVSATGTESVSTLEYPSPTTRRFTDPAGRVTIYEFSDGGNLMVRHDPDGRTHTMEYTADGKLVAVTDEDGRRSWTYGPDGNIASFTNAEGETSRIERDPSASRMTRIHPDGTRQERLFDGLGNLVSFKDEAGAVTAITREVHGQVETVTDAQGRVSRLEYDACGGLSVVHDNLGQITRLDRNSVGLEIQRTSPGGRTTRTEYTGQALVAAVVDGEGGRTTIDHDALGEIASITEPGGARTQLEHARINGRNLLIRITDAEGGVWKLTYDSSGRLLAQEDPLGRRTTSELDAGGRVSRVVFPDLTGLNLRHNPSGLLSELINARFASTRLTYDHARRVTSIRRTDGSQETVAYDLRGQISRWTDPVGCVESFLRDAVGRTIARIDKLGNLWSRELSRTGVVTQVTDPLDRTTLFERDGLDRITALVDPGGHRSLRELDPDGLLIGTTNPRQKTSSSRFDGNAQLIESLDSLGGTVQRAYSAAHDLETLTDENGHSWEYTWDRLHRKTTETDPNGRIRQYRYNPASELIEDIQRDGSRVQLTHDLRGRVTERTLIRPDGSLEDQETLSYDAVGNLIRRENHATRITSTFDLMDREIQRIVLIKRTGSTRILQFSWDAMGRLQVLRNGPRSELYSYDCEGRPLQILVLDPARPGQPSVAGYASRLYTLTWDEVGNLTQLDYPNRTRMRRAYDAANRVSSIVHERVEGSRAVTLASWAFVRDENGNIAQTTREDGSVLKYTMDDKDQLVRFQAPPELCRAWNAARRARRSQGPGAGWGGNDDEDEVLLPEDGEVLYQWDLAGNRVRETAGSRTIVSTFSPANELITRGSTRYVHDLRGFLTEKRSASGARDLFRFDVAGRLASFTRGHPRVAGLTEEVERYAYDPDDQRVLVEDMKSGTLTTQLWDRMRPIEESRLTKAGTETITRFLHDPMGDLLEQAHFTRRGGAKGNNGVGNGEDPAPPGLPPENDGLGTGPGNPGNRGGASSALGAVSSSEPFANVSWVHGDQIGSTSLMTDVRGRVVNRLAYGPWGEELTGRFDLTPFTYASTQRAGAPGLNYMLHRWYSPTQGRFLSRDPIGFDGGQINLYQYVGNNPLLVRDPMGTGPFGKIITSATQVIDRVMTEMKIAEWTADIKGLRSDIAQVNMKLEDWRCRALAITEKVQQQISRKKREGLDDTRLNQILEELGPVWERIDFWGNKIQDIEDIVNAFEARMQAVANERRRR